MADEDPDTKVLPRTGPITAVLAFQPRRFEVFTGERLKDWERLVREEVGLNAGDLGAIAAAGSCTASRSGPSDAAYDDCDVDQV